MGKKVISYCLFGNKIKYCHGIIESVIASNILFLDWEVWIYYSIGTQKVPDSVINILKNLNCKLIPYEEVNKGNFENIEGMFRRFTPFANEDVDYWLSRDCDSRMSFTEKQMVDEWIKSNKTIHTILSHHCHGGIMGGLFGINNINIRNKYPDTIIDINNLIESNFNSNIKPLRGKDQDWINNHLNNIINKNDIFVHLANNKGCIQKCHIKHKNIPDNYDFKFTDDTFDFCGKQINYTHSTLKRPFIEITNLFLSDVINKN